MDVMQEELTELHLAGKKDLGSQNWQDHSNFAAQKADSIH